MKWFRLYSEARNDAKLRHLKDDEFRVWFNLLCFSNEQKDSRGSIPYHSYTLLAVEVANGDEELLQRTLEQLVMLRIVEDKDGTITFINFKKRNYDNPSDQPEEVRKRVQKHRAKKRNDNVTTMKREETIHNTDTDSESDKDDDDDDACARGRGEIFQQFEQEFGRPLSPIEAQEITEWLDNHSPELITQALKEAVIRGSVRIKYIDTILANWHKNNIRTPAEAIKYSEKRKKHYARGDPMKDASADLDSKYADIYIT